VEIVFVDLEWPREVKHNVDTDLSEPLVTEEMSTIES